MKFRTRLFTALLVLASVSGACSSEDGSGDERREEARSGTSKAVMVSALRRTPDAAQLYVGVYPQLPKGELDGSKMLSRSGAAPARS